MTKTYTGSTPDEAFDALQSALNAYHMAVMTAIEGKPQSKPKGVTTPAIEVTAPEPDADPFAEFDITTETPAEVAPAAAGAKPKKPRAKPKAAKPKADLEAGDMSTDANIQKQADAPGQAGKGNGFDPDAAKIDFDTLLAQTSDYIKASNDAAGVMKLLSEKYGASRLSEVAEDKRGAFLADLGIREYN